MVLAATLHVKCGSLTAQRHIYTQKTSEISYRLRFTESGRVSFQNVIFGNVGRRNLRLMAKPEQDSEGGNLGDDMLDFLYAGKKLRKW